MKHTSEGHCSHDCSMDWHPFAEYEGPSGRPNWRNSNVGEGRPQSCFCYGLRTADEIVRQGCLVRNTVSRKSSDTTMVCAFESEEREKECVERSGSDAQEI